MAQKERKKLSVCVAGFCVSFSLMLAEALLLRHFSLQRHDSMYLLGGILAQKERKKLSVCVAGFCVSFSLMLAEALLLRHFSLQRHDSMYLLLPFCMYFLFESLLHIYLSRCCISGAEGWRFCATSPS